MDMKQHTKNKPQRRDDANAFIPESSLRTGTGDELAQQLAEGHQRAVTTGEDDAEDARDALQTEEIGGPFLVSGPEEEFGQEASYWDTSGEEGFKYLFEAAKAYVTGTRPDSDNDEKRTGHVKL